jgi:hypothetical protein
MNQAYSFDISEEEVTVEGPDGLNLSVKGRVPDKWVLIIVALIASAFGLNEIMGGM